MKTAFTLFLCVLTLVISAGNNGAMSAPVTAPGPVTAHVNEAPAPADANSVAPLKGKKGKKGWKFRDRPVFYILCGAGILLVVGLEVLLGGSSYNSRDGVQ